MQLEVHVGHDTEIAATAPQGPEQLLFTVMQGSDDAAVGENNFGAEQIVKRKSKPAN